MLWSSVVRATILVFLLAACSSERSPVPGNESARLSDSQLQEFKRSAIDGSVAAAHALTLHYRYADLQPLEVEKWLVYADKYGDADAKVSLGSLLAREHNFYPVSKDSCARGVAYLMAATNQGSAAAAEMLKDLSPICTKPWLQ